jgi:hypothetical protein
VAGLQQVLAFVARSFDQGAQRPADERPPPGLGDRLLRLEQLAMPAPRGAPRHALRQLGARRALFRAVDEGAEVIELGGANEFEQVLEVLLRLAREADDEGGAQEDVRRQLARLGEQPLVAHCRAAAAHRR